MARAVVLTLLLVLANGAEQEPSMGAAVQAKKNPLRKVITLIEEMKKQVETEAEDDAKAYENYECWCTKGEKEKTEAVAEADRRIADLTAFLEEAAGTEGQLKTEIAGLAADIKEDNDALDSATGVRQQDKAAFDQSEADMKETLAALKEALQVLSKVNLVQKSKHGAMISSKEAHAASASLLQIRNVVEQRFPHSHFHDVMQRDLYEVLGMLKDAPHQGAKKSVDTMSAAFLGEVFLPKRQAAALEQRTGEMKPNYWEPSEEEAGAAKKKNGLSGAAAGAKSYNSRSGQIFGVLGGLNDQFIRDLSNAQKEEFQALVQFEHLRAAKLAEIASATALKEQKETQLAELLRKAAQAREDVTKTQDALSADQKFLLNLKETCTTEANGYEDRSKIRSEEIKALGETLSILNDDDARSTFGKTLGFMQIGSISLHSASAAEVAAAQDRLADKVMRKLAAVARKNQNMLLASLAVRVRLDAFDKVREIMDKMLKDLNAQQAEEYEKNEACKKSIDETEDEIKVKSNEADDLAENHQSLTNTLSTLDRDMTQLKADVAANEVSLKQAGEARKAESQLFAQTVQDQRATVNILQKALKRLQEFYTPDGQFIQTRANQPEPGAAIAPPPAKPADYRKSDAAGGALQMLMKVINDAQASEAESVVSEQHSQASYATLVQDTKASIEADRAAIASKQEEDATAEGDKSETEEAQVSTADMLAKQREILQAHHQECDWLMKFFDVRQKSRSEEMDAITDAKAILSGASFGK
jgi:hypothetical protein